MLGVRRPVVNVAASALYKAGLIQYWRGSITVELSTGTRRPDPQS